MRVLLFFFTFLMVTQSYTSTSKEYIVTLAVNLEDCLNCNRALFDLAPFKNDIDIRIVFRKEYQIDSSFIFEQYQFKKLADEIFWSDSLFKEYSPHGVSTLNLESHYSLGKVSVNVNRAYHENFFDFLNNQLKPVNVLFQEFEGLARGVSHFKVSEDGLLGMNTKYKGVFSLYDLFSQTKLYDLVMTENILRASFRPNIDQSPEYEFDAQQKAMKEAGVPALYEISDYLFLEDTLLLRLQNNFFEYESRFIAEGVAKIDTFLTHTYALLKYYKGDLISIHPYENLKKLEYHLYSTSMQPHVYGSKIYEQVNGFPIDKNRGYLAEMFLNKEGAYEMNVFTNPTVPAVYAEALDFSHLVYYKNTYAFTLLDQLYNLNTHEVIEQLDFFEPTYEILNNSWPNMYISEHGYVLNDDYVWMTVTKGGKSVLQQYYKMNRHTRSVAKSAKEFDISQNFVASAFDPLNPDYIIYKNEDNQLVRERIF